MANGRDIPPQYNVPSQRPSARQPYDNRYQGDVKQFPAVQAPAPFAPFGSPNYGGPNVNEENVVLSTWDSRPINSRDFLFTTPLEDVILAGDRTFAFQIPIPNSRVYFLRHWTLSVIFATAGAPIINADGTSNVRMALDFLIDGIPSIDYSNVVYNTLPFGGIENDCFLALNQNTLFTFGGRIEASVSADITMIGGQIELTGNSILSDSRDIGLQSATPYAVPVRAVP